MACTAVHVIQKSVLYIQVTLEPNGYVEAKHKRWIEFILAQSCHVHRIDRTHNEAN